MLVFRFLSHTYTHNLLLCLSLSVALALYQIEIHAMVSNACIAKAYKAHTNFIYYIMLFYTRHSKICTHLFLGYIFLCLSFNSVTVNAMCCWCCCCIYIALLLLLHFEEYGVWCVCIFFFVFPGFVFTFMPVILNKQP